MHAAAHEELKKTTGAADPIAIAPGEKNSCQVLGIGTPVVDYLFYVSQAYVDAKIGLQGGSILVDQKAFQQILDDNPSPAKVIAGGGTANTLKGLSQLGHSCALSGKVGPDETGALFSESMEACGIASCLAKGTLPTARAACLITPGGERTMRTLIGAGAEMRGEDLPRDLFQGVQLVHLEGYLLTRKNLAEKAMELAKAAGAVISFDLSSIEIVKEFRKTLLDLMTHYVDIVFANEEEANILTGMPPERSCILLRDLTHIAVVKTGSKGCWAAAKNKRTYHNAFMVDVLDATGAGDLFASGFLHGFLNGKSLELSLTYGSYIASEVVQVLGAEIPELRWPEIRKCLQHLPKDLLRGVVFLSTEV